MTYTPDPKYAQVRAAIAELDEIGAPDEDYIRVVSSGARVIKWHRFPSRRAAVIDFWERAEARARARHEAEGEFGEGPLLPSRLVPGEDKR